MKKIKILTHIGCIILLHSSSIYAAAEETNQHDLFQAIRNNDIKAVNSAIANGADVNEIKSRSTPLSFAIHNIARYNGNPKIIDALIEAGANPNGSNNLIPLKLAVYNESADIFQKLLDHGADIYIYLDNPADFEPSAITEVINKAGPAYWFFKPRPFTTVESWKKKFETHINALQDNTINQPSISQTLQDKIKKLAIQRTKVKLKQKALDSATAEAASSY